MYKNESAIITPETANTVCFCLDNATSHGAAVSIDPTDAPNPSSTSKEGKAQHTSVLTEVNSERQLNTGVVARRGLWTSNRPPIESIEPRSSAEA